METATAPRLPLQRYRLFESHDMDEARESVARVFCPHKLLMLRPRTELDACHHSARLHRDVSLNYVQYGPAVQIDPGYLQDFFLLQIPLRGGAEIRSGAIGSPSRRGRRGLGMTRVGPNQASRP